MFVGIDPGKKGAIAIMTEEPTIFKMPQEENREDLVSILKNIKDIGAKVIIEKQITKQMIGKSHVQDVRLLYHIGIHKREFIHH